MSQPAAEASVTAAERVARAFHETYEALAPEHSYETRKASAVPWADVPANNKSLMIAVVSRLIADGTIATPMQGTAVVESLLKTAPDRERRMTKADLEAVLKDVRAYWGKVEAHLLALLQDPVERLLEAERSAQAEAQRLRDGAEPAPVEG